MFTLVGEDLDFNATSRALNLPAAVADEEPIRKLEFDTEASYWSNFSSAGRLFGGTITDAGGGQVNIAAGAGLVKNESASLEGVPSAINAEHGSARTLVTWTQQTNFALAGVGYNLIYWDASAGAFAVQLKENFYANFDFTRDFTIGRVYYDGSVVTIRLCGMDSWNFARRVQMFGEEVFPVKRGFGMKIAATGTRNISVTAGVLWAEAVNRFSTNAFDSSGAGRFTYWYRDGLGGWTAVTGQSQISNTSYDDGDGSLGTVLPQQYGVHWVYMVHDSSVHVVYGRNSYLSTEVNSAAVPATLPGIVDAYATLLGRIIIQRDAASFASILSAFDTTFVGEVALSHNDLGGLQGGTTAEYYHLTAAQRSALVSATQGYLSGRGASSGPGVLEPITVGSGLSLLGQTLSAAHSLDISGPVKASAIYCDTVAVNMDLSSAVWYLTAIDGVTGSVQVDLLYDNGGGYASVTNGNEPAISSGTHASGNTTGWSKTSFAAGDKIAYQIDSLTDITAIHLQVTG